MLSRSLKLVVRVAFRNHLHFNRIINKQNKMMNYYHFGRSITQWTPNQTTYNPSNEHEDYKKSQDRTNRVNPLATDTDTTMQNTSSPSFSEKLNQVYGKSANDRRTQEPSSDPLHTMYENVAKDEDLNPKDNLGNEDNMKSSEKGHNITTDNLYDMSLHQNDTSNVSDNKTQDTSKQQSGTNKNNLFHKVNQEENFNDVYVGDVEHKIPTKNLNERHEQILNEVKTPADINTKWSQNYTKENKNEPQSPLYGNLTNENQQYSGGNRDYTTHENKQKKKIIATNADLDLSSGNFQENMKKYEEKMSGSSDTNVLSDKSPPNEDYYLKENDSDYNKFLDNKGDSKLKNENKNLKDINNKRRMENKEQSSTEDNYFPLFDDNDYEIDRELREENKLHNNRNKEM